MGIYSDPPAARDFSADKATLLVCWWCTSFAVTIIFFRVVGRYIRTEKLFPEDWLAFACIIPLLIRMGFVHVILAYGTNNTVTYGMSDAELARRQIGSKLVLASRVFYAATLWMLKLTISEFFKRLTLQIWKRSYEIILRGIRWFLLATFVATVIADICECHPTTHYWQVVPDPGPQCRQGFAQLLTMGVANVTTDLLLVVFPIPIILMSQMSMQRKFHLVLLFSLSIFPVIVTLYRVPNIISRGGVQQYRSLWASIEILVATAVANALVLGSFVRDRGVKKAKWKFGSTTESMERTTSSRRGTAIRHWGSDEDLVRDMAMAVGPELRDGQNDGVPRIAPMADQHAHPTMVGARTDWAFPVTRGDAESDETELVKELEPPRSPGDMSVVSSPRRVSFFDVSNLLGDSQPATPQRNPSIATDGTSLAPSMSFDIPPTLQPKQQPQQTKKGSMALLQDVGGLLSPSPRMQRAARRSIPAAAPAPGPGPGPGTGGIEMHSINGTAQPLQRRTTEQSLQDVGGLLK